MHYYIVTIPTKSRKSFPNVVFEQFGVGSAPWPMLKTTKTHPKMHLFSSRHHTQILRSGAQNPTPKHPNLTTKTPRLLRSRARNPTPKHPNCTTKTPRILRSGARNPTPKHTNCTSAQKHLYIHQNGKKQPPKPAQSSSKAPAQPHLLATKQR